MVGRGGSAHRQGRCCVPPIYRFARQRAELSDGLVCPRQCGSRRREPAPELVRGLVPALGLGQQGLVLARDPSSELDPERGCAPRPPALAYHRPRAPSLVRKPHSKTEQITRLSFSLIDPFGGLSCPGLLLSCNLPCSSHATNV